MIFPFRPNVANVLKPIVALLLVFNFYEMYMLFCIKDVPTACLPLGGALVPTQEKKKKKT